MTESRPTLVEGARRWLEAGPREGPVRQALTDFVEARYRGNAAAVKRVHDKRADLLSDHRPLIELGPAARGPWDDGTVALAAEHSAPPDQGRLLYHLTRAFRPGRVIELGTNIGISAAYLATGLAANAAGHLTTLEASGLRLLLARDLLGKLGLTGLVTTVEGYFDDTLPEVLAGDGFDMAFVDGNHTEEATVRYFDLLVDHSSPDAVLLFDDIRWSEGMSRAWATLSAHPVARICVDLGRTGIILL